jgi:hypothetical protein
LLWKPSPNDSTPSSHTLVPDSGALAIGRLRTGGKPLVEVAPGGASPSAT